MAATHLLWRIDAAIRSAPASTHPSDTLLIIADTLDETVAHLWSINVPHQHLPHAPLAQLLRERAAQARALAPILAEPRPVEACADLLRRERAA